MQPQTLKTNDATLLISPRTATRCDHREEGAIRFQNGRWECRSCGSTLQVNNSPKAWDAFGQISRALAYCAVLAAVVPAALAALPHSAQPSVLARNVPMLTMESPPLVMTSAENDNDEPENETRLERASIVRATRLVAVNH